MVEVVDDDRIEKMETVYVALLPRTRYEVKIPFTATIKILDDDTSVAVAATDPRAGEPGTGRGSGVFTFTRVGATELPLTVDFTVSGTATSEADYDSIGTSVTFQPGSTRETKLVEVQDDLEAEGIETVTVRLNHRAEYRISNRPATVTIADDDITIVTVVATDPTAGEPRTGEGTGTWTFYRAGPTVKPLTVRFAVSPGSIPADYKAIKTSITFAAGSATAVQTLFVTDDTEFEPDDAVTITLIDGAAYNLGSPSVATITIIDDDTPITVSASDPTAGEPLTAAGTGKFTFTRSGNTSFPLTVNYSVGGSATAGEDYAQLSPVTFRAGEATATNTVQVMDDNAVEEPETVVVMVSDESSATVTIEDDDAELTVTAPDDLASEPRETLGTGKFTFARTGFLDRNLTVNFTVSGTAVTDVDYTSIGTDVAFAPGEATAEKIVRVLPDIQMEPIETVRVTLAAGTGYAIGSPASALVDVINFVPTSVVVLQVTNFLDAQGGWGLRLMRLYENGFLTTEVNQTVYIEVFKLPRFAVNIVGQWGCD